MHKCKGKNYRKKTFAKLFLVLQKYSWRQRDLSHTIKCKKSLKIDLYDAKIVKGLTFVETNHDIIFTLNKKALLYYPSLRQHVY